MQHVSGLSFGVSAGPILAGSQAVTRLPPFPALFLLVYFTEHLLVSLNMKGLGVVGLQQC